MAPIAFSLSLLFSGVSLFFFLNRDLNLNETTIAWGINENSECERVCFWCVRDTLYKWPRTKTAVPLRGSLTELCFKCTPSCISPSPFSSTVFSSFQSSLYQTSLTGVLTAPTRWLWQQVFWFYLLFFFTSLYFFLWVRVMVYQSESSWFDPGFPGHIPKCPWAWPQVIPDLHICVWLVVQKCFEWSVRIKKEIYS